MLFYWLQYLITLVMLRRNLIISVATSTEILPFNHHRFSFTSASTLTVFSLANNDVNVIPNSIEYLYHEYVDNSVAYVLPGPLGPPPMSCRSPADRPFAFACTESAFEMQARKMSRRPT